MTVDAHTILMLDREAKEAFIKDVEENGIYLVKPPHAHIRYDTVKAVYHEFPFIQPVQLYIDKFGIAKKPIMRKCIVGTKYMYALKQTSNKNFSARSMGRVNKKGTPEKSTDKRDNRAEISHNPLKLGEVHNLMSAVSGREMAEHNLFTRSSPVGRRSLSRILQATGDPAKIHKIKVKADYRNVNAEIFAAYIKSWGLRVNFLTDVEGIDDVIMDVAQPFRVHGFTVIDLPSRRDIYANCFEEYDRRKSENIYIMDAETNLDDFIWDEIFQSSAFKDTPSDIQEVCRGATKGLYENVDHTEDEEEDDT